MTGTTDYVHGYGEREAERLLDQADTVRNLLHHDTRYAPGERVLEAGCGVGAQTTALAANSPGAAITSIDISEESLKTAEHRVRAAGYDNVAFQHADLFRLPFEDASFDHVFVCYVLEHLVDPVAALKALKRVLRPGGTITVIEGDHGSCYFHPSTPEARAAWECLITVQRSLGGNSLIGRELYPLLAQAGFRDVSVSPRLIYADDSMSVLKDGFVLKTIIPMVEGVETAALVEGIIDRDTWEKGMRDLYHVHDSPDGVFNYTFFKGTAVL